MKQKMVAIFVAFVLAVSLAACGAGEETTITGMVVSVDGSIVSLVEMDAKNMNGEGFAESDRPQMPEGMEGFQGFGDFNPEDFEGMLPEDGSIPQWGSGEMPENFTMPENFSMPEGGMPDFGEGMPNFGGNGGMGSRFENFASDAETKELDLGEAHISVEIDGGKETGSIDNIKVGTFVTVTMNGKGKVTYVLVSSQFGFVGGRGSTSFF